MDTDTAIRLAAAVESEVTIAQARSIIQGFLNAARYCPVCSNTGEFKFGVDVKLNVLDSHRKHVEGWRVPNGTSSACPLCSGLDPDPGEGEPMRGDPEHLAWYCKCLASVEDCRQARGKGDADHADCDWRVMLPIGAV